MIESPVTVNEQLEQEHCSQEIFEMAKQRKVTTARMARLLKSGKSVAEIARLVGRHYSSVRNRLCRVGAIDGKVWN